MERVRFGRTELSVSRIALGGIPIMRRSLEDGTEVVREALRLGINFIDTANAYGDSEEKVGLGIKGVPREELVLATKSGARDKQGLKKHLDLSLERLGVDYIDIYQLHHVTEAKRAEVFAPGGACEGLMEAVQEGKVRFPAFTCHSIPLGMEIMRENRFDSVQLPFNYLDDMAAAEAIPLARELDMGFIAMKPLGGGMLYDVGLSFRYLLQFDNIVPDPGIEKLEEIREIAGIVKAGQAFSDDDKREIERVRTETGDTWCHRCDYCQPCPQGIGISAALNAASYLKRFSLEEAKGFAQQAIERARDCQECRECVARCPYDLDIPALLPERIAYWDAHVG
ncbi:MAG: aldo/keto reductase [Coriobacteriia bacterium]|nr:aldo/keto reductase [Coriobacteriia bacterium]